MAIGYQRSTLSDLLAPSGQNKQLNSILSSSGNRYEFDSAPQEYKPPTRYSQPTVSAGRDNQYVGMDPAGAEYYSGFDPDAVYRQYMHRMGFGTPYDMMMGYKS